MMEKSENVFEIEASEGPLSKQVIVRPKHTTDGIPVYQCHLPDGALICELRREPSGEWVQLWGNLPDDSVTRLGDAIRQHAT